MPIVFSQYDSIYQQDNWKYHTADSVRARFEKHQDEFSVLLWPANSPDTSPIENLGDRLERVVRTMDPYPGLAAVRSVKGGYSNF
ncbi:DDE_3 domain-containing protein [Trichonephila clavipes]|nr:DDE_3 domain-containing protein [Trichonephila clavipes]